MHNIMHIVHSVMLLQAMTRSAFCNATRGIFHNGVILKHLAAKQMANQKSICHRSSHFHSTVLCVVNVVKYFSQSYPF